MIAIVAALYSEETKASSVKERQGMAERYSVETDDVDHAAWVLAKDVIWAKLGQDCAEKKGKGKKK